MTGISSIQYFYVIVAVAVKPSWIPILDSGGWLLDVQVGDDFGKYSRCSLARQGE